MKISKFNEIGRSMVEMLGVLAIIGVLSVGAIAGYSKAMMKYKLNKQAHQLNTVISAMEKYAHSFNNLKEEQSITTYLTTLNEIPEEMLNKNFPTVLYDIFDTQIYCKAHPKDNTTSAWKDVVSLSLYPNLSQINEETLAICKNIYDTIKEHNAQVYYAYTTSGYNSDDERESSAFYGNDYCSETKKCLKNLDTETIYQLCTLHIGTNKSASINILWKM